MRRIVIELSEQDYRFACKYPEVLFGSYAKAIKNGTVLPDNPTNGDMIKATFPDTKVNTTKYSYVVEVKLPYHTEHDTGLLFDRDWWDAPYREDDDK